MGNIIKSRPLNPVRRSALFGNQEFLARLRGVFKSLPSHLFRESFSLPVLRPRHSYGVKLIAGIIASSEDIFSKTEEALQRIFGPLDYRSQAIKFDFTDYYQKDMGPDLKRRFVSFERPIDPTALFRIKHITNRLERRLSKGITPHKRMRRPSEPASNHKSFSSPNLLSAPSSGAKAVRRVVNIDPGYITGAKLVLASTKDYSHRIYLDKGVYAEATLYYKKGSFRYWDWTYPDYKTEEYIRIFNDIRSIYMNKRPQRCS